MGHAVYLVRHGQSEWNVRRLTQGQTPHPPLTSLGREQSRAAAEAILEDLDGGPAGLIVTSDLARAVETAEILAARLQAPVERDARLREQSLGWLEGRGYDETWAFAERHDWSDPTLPVAGGESLMDVYRRMAAVLAEVGPETPTVLVSHGDSIRVAVAHLTGAAPHEAPWVDVPNGAVLKAVDGQVQLAVGRAPEGSVSG